MEGSDLPPTELFSEEAAERAESSAPLCCHLLTSDKDGEITSRFTLVDCECLRLAF